MAKLRESFTLRVNRHDRPLTKSEILRGVREAGGLIAMLSDSIDREVIQTAPHLKVIANYAVGFNNVDCVAASERGIWVTNTPGVLTEATADLTFGLILSVARRLAEAEETVRSGTWTGWSPTQFVGADVYGKTLGIIGMGRIGQAVARRAQGFSMRLLYYNRHPLSADDERRLSARFSPLSELLSQADFISLHLPLTRESHHLIDEKALCTMQPTAFLINTSRGAIVDEKALIRALYQRKIAGAGLDVYEAEPSIPRRLMKMKQVVLLPHIGSASAEARVRMGMMVIENLMAALAEKRPPNAVNDVMRTIVS